MDLAMLEMNYEKHTEILLNIYENILGIQVWPETRYRYSLMMKQRAELNKKKSTDAYKTRRSALKKEALRVNANRTLEKAKLKASLYKEPTNEEYVSNLVFDLYLFCVVQ